jgi:hypothetical protein
MHSAEAQFGLFMPVAAPKPNDPTQVTAGTTPVPRFDRRHHYWWAWEDRRVARVGFSGAGQTTTTNAEETTITMKQFW